MAEGHEQKVIEIAITIHDNDYTDQLISLMTKLKINEKPEFYSHAYQWGERWECDMTVKINPPRGERDMYYFRTRHRWDTPGEDYCTLQDVDYHEQPVKATMSIWMEAADDMYEEALEHMDVQRKRLEEAERREAVLKHKYRILHELYEEREKHNSILNICVARAAFCLHQIPNMGSDDDDDDDGMEGHISPVREDEPHPQDNGEGVLQGLPPSPPPLYPIYSDDEAEEMHSAIDISEPSQEPEVLRPNRVFDINDLNTAPIWTESPDEEEDPEE
ncbi:hypothetical protein OsJ_19004 [Oryza sativa Japonica Group]|uniref:Uncharacterized protein n=1 Tax=Oryza sativa subsp. japonica TaxID=39947 RepID=B9FKV4_ORYSJ|nr:hypothetical protein OsJ_19004 [Oryza sativa Japonica Group]